VLIKPVKGFSIRGISSNGTVLPPGISELPRDKHFNDQIDLWLEGDMHISPLSIEGIYKIKESEYTLYPVQTGVHDENWPTTGNNSICQIYPNPFSFSTTFRYNVSVPAFVSLRVYNTLGDEVSLLVDQFHKPGTYSSRFLSDRTSYKLLAGMYFYRLIIGDRIVSGKIIMLE